jgi:hypothetical protein
LSGNNLYGNSDEENPKSDESGESSEETEKDETGKKVKTRRNEEIGDNDEHEENENKITEYSENEGTGNKEKGDEEIDRNQEKKGKKEKKEILLVVVVEKTKAKENCQNFQIKRCTIIFFIINKIRLTK